MADQLLSQADVDALVASLTQNQPAAPAKPAAPAPAPAAPPAAARPAAPAPKPVGPAAAFVPAKPDVSSEVIDGLNAKIADLTRQLNQMSQAVQRIEFLEKKLAEVEAKSRTPKESPAVAQKVQALDQELQKISANLKGTPGYGVRYSFSCEKCHDHGHVAVMYRCTKCGQERWYGWWPNKK